MKALIIVDVQNDFLPGGALAVPGGDWVIAVANRLMQEFDLVVATKDWHPPDHVSFAVNHKGMKPGDVIDLDGVEQVLWPPHCVQGTEGAKLGPGLAADRVDKTILKGTDPCVDSYSGFFDNGRRHSTGLAEYLRGNGVSETHIVGLATDYCVKYTALDAVEQGFLTHLIEEGCRGINLRPGDVERAVEEMKAAGVEVPGC